MKTKFWRKTYLLTLSLFLVFMLAALCAYTIIVYNSDMSSEADAARAEAEKLAGIYEDNIKSRYQYKTDHGYVTYVEDEEMQQEMRFISSVYLSQNSMIEFVLPNGRTLYSTFPSEYGKVDGAYSVEKTDSERFVVVSYERERPDAFLKGVTLARSLVDFDSAFSRLAWMLSGAALALSALLALLLYLILRRLSKPLSDLRSITEKVGAGDLSAKAEVRGKDEFALLAQSFNTMTGRIDDQMRLLRNSAVEKQQLVDNMAHELRTPLTTICAGADLLYRTKMDEEQKIEMLLSIEHEGQRLKRVSEILLDDAYIRAAGIEKVDVDLCSLLGDTIKRLHPCAKNAGVSLTLEGGPCTVKGDAILLGVLFSNLIENAVKACTEGEKVEVVLHADQGRPLVTVADNGRGMTKEQLARITEPFYRVDRARSRADGGTGLGLALCKTICTSHGAELSFMSAPGAGTEVSVCFY